MKKLVLFLTILLVANVTYAQVPPDPDQINVYFDLTDYPVDVVYPIYSSVPCYLVVSHPTAASIAGWECVVSWDPVLAATIGPYTFEGNALNILVAPEFAVGLAEPIPTSEATLLVSWTLFLMSEECLAITVLPAPQPSTPDNVPLYVDGEDLNNLVLLGDPCGYDQQGVPEPCAGINCITATESTSWSTLKALYR